MTRLLMPSGGLVVCRQKGRQTMFTVTAYDLATGVGLAVGHALSGSLVGRPVEHICGLVTAPGEEIQTWSPYKYPRLGWVAAQNKFGVAIHRKGPIYGGAYPIGTPKAGDAVILTHVADRSGPQYSAAIDILNARNWGDPWTEEVTAAYRSIFLPETRGIPIRIKSVAWDGFVMETPEGAIHGGMSGSPILQNGHLVGAVYGDDRGTPIARMVDNLIDKEVGTVPGGGNGVNGRPKHPHRKGSGGKTVRKSQAAASGQHSAKRRTAVDDYQRYHTGSVFHRQLVRQWPEIQKLETWVLAYEEGMVSEGVLIGSQRLGYMEALRRIWDYHQTAGKLWLRSWVTAGVITSKEAADIVNGGRDR